MTYSPKHAVAWTEIPVSDLKKAVAFYNDVFDYGLKIDDSGPNPLAMLNGAGVSGHFYPGKPAGDGSGPTIHLNVPGRLEDTTARWKKAGGTVLTDPIEIPPGRFAYALDPDGNSIGLFEAKQA